MEFAQENPAAEGENLFSDGESTLSEETEENTVVQDGVIYWRFTSKHYGRRLFKGALECNNNRNTRYNGSNQLKYFDSWEGVTISCSEHSWVQSFEFQSFASDGKTILRTKKSASSKTVLRKAPNNIYVRARYWKTENGQKVYSAWSNMEHLYLDLKGGNMILKNASVKGNKVKIITLEKTGIFAYGFTESLFKKTYS